MDPIVCSWLEKKKMIHDRDIWSHYYMCILNLPTF
jgi:hypothetical protein